MGNYAGVDWATDKHDLPVQDEAAETLLSASFLTTRRGCGPLCRTLIRMEVELVAIERPDGLLVEDVEVADDGTVVVSVRPNARERDRCPHCRRRCPGYDWGEGRRRWRALDLGTTFCYLEAWAPRVSCRRHGWWSRPSRGRGTTRASPARSRTRSRGWPSTPTRPRSPN